MTHICPRCGWILTRHSKCQAPWACQERRADPNMQANRRDPEFLRRLRESRGEDGNRLHL